MQLIIDAVLSCGLFLIAGIAGLLLRGRLPERHRDRETLDFVRLAVGALVTFLAIVLGLLTASSKAHFDNVGNSYRLMASELVRLDRRLRDTGAEADPIRAEMRAYLAAVIFSTWPDEPAPSGAFPRGLASGQREGLMLSALIENARQQLAELHTSTPLQIASKQAAAERLEAFSDARWAVIETDHPTIPSAFYGLMLFWTALMFIGFGLCAPRNAVVAVTVLICAISLASVIYVILELEGASSGLIVISSAPLRDALADLDRP